MPPSWRDVVGWEGWYEVSDEGAVRRTRREHGTRPGYVLKPYEGKRGYHRVSLWRNGEQRGQFGPHRLVAAAFIGPCPDGQEVDHIDRNVQNNNLSNLRYLTQTNNRSRRRFSAGS